MIKHSLPDVRWPDRETAAASRLFQPAELFWWPALGFDIDSTVPETTALQWRLVLELAAIVLAWVAWRRYGLDDPAARDRLLRQGHLPASVRQVGRR